MRGKRRIAPPRRGLPAAAPGGRRARVGYYCRWCGEEVELCFDARAAAWYRVCPNCGASEKFAEGGAPAPGRPSAGPEGRAELPRRFGLVWGGRRP